jgi:hypothetical protein
MFIVTAVNQKSRLEIVSNNSSCSIVVKRFVVKSLVLGSGVCLGHLRATNHKTNCRDLSSGKICSNMGYNTKMERN